MFVVEVTQFIVFLLKQPKQTKMTAKTMTDLLPGLFFRLLNMVLKYLGRFYSVTSLWDQIPQNVETDRTLLSLEFLQ